MRLFYNSYKDDKIEEEWDVLKKLDSNIKNYYNSETIQLQAIGKEEVAIGTAEIQAKFANEFNRIPKLNSALAYCPEWMQKEYKAMDVDLGVI